MDATSYGFTVEWYDKQADMIREYQLTAYQSPKGPLEVAMYDPKARRSFLKRMEVPGLDLQDLHIGGIVTVHARQLKVTGYNDPRTRAAFEELHAPLYLVSAPGAFRQYGELLSAVERAGLRVGRLRLVNAGGPVVVLEVAGGEAEGRWADVEGTLPAGALRRAAPEEARAYFDRARYPTTAAYNNCSLCIIRPHALKDRVAGEIISAILASGLEVSAAESVHLQRAEATELLDVYKGVLPFFSELVDCMSSGPAIALEVRAPGGVVAKLREVCGPYDVDIARHLRPKTIRARFGKDNAQNAVHVTDLEEDGELEVSYIFDAVLGKR